VTAAVLVVDDDFDLRETLADVLQDEGFTVATAADGLAALDYLRAGNRPAVILLDWMMPHCDGAQFRAEQLSDTALAGIPVVLLTADTRREEKMAELAVETVITKPCDRSVLVATIRKYVADTGDRAR
jgi:CheY-like chemotaxis protein